MLEVLQTSTISSTFAATLGREVTERLGAQIGDYIMFYSDDENRIRIAKVKPSG